MWVACSRSRWAPGFPGREDRAEAGLRRPTPSLCPQASGAPALAAAHMGKGRGEGFLGPRGAGSDVCPFHDPCVWESEKRGEDSAAFALKESAT